MRMNCAKVFLKFLIWSFLSSSVKVKLNFKFFCLSWTEQYPGLGYCELSTRISSVPALASRSSALGFPLARRRILFLYPLIDTVNKNSVISDRCLKNCFRRPSRSDGLSPHCPFPNSINFEIWISCSEMPAFAWLFKENFTLSMVISWPGFLWLLK